MDILESLLDYQVEPAKRILKRASKAKVGQTVFFGDSITECYDLERYYPGKLYYNCGISGATSTLLLRMHSYCVGDYQPKCVVLLVGTNDLNDHNQYGVLDVIQNVYHLITIMNERYALSKIILISPLPIQESVRKGLYYSNRLLKMLGKEMVHMIQEFDNVQYVDVYESFLNQGELNRDFTYDGLHLSEAGYEQLTSILSGYLNDNE